MPPTKDKRELFEKCWGCDGTRKLKHPVHVDYSRTKSANLAPGGDCPLCSDGYMATGVTIAQLEAMRTDRDRLLVLLDDVRQQESGPVPGFVIRALQGRSAHVAEARRKAEAQARKGK